MSWDNTVRCSHCYGKGHNKAGCESLRENMKQRINDDPDDWRAKRYFEQKARSIKRTCSYCSNAGHNRKTCRELIHAKETTTCKAAEWRHEAMDYFKRIGIGVGALVRYNNDAVGLITNIDWYAMDHRYRDKTYHEERAFVFSDVRNAKMSANIRLPIPKDEANIVTGEDYEPWYNVEVISAVSGQAIEGQVPSDWLTGAGCADRIFDKDTQPYNVSDWVETQGFYDNS